MVLDEVFLVPLCHAEDGASATRSLNFIKIRYNIGITNNVNTVENARPQTIAVATGAQIDE